MRGKGGKKKWDEKKGEREGKERGREEKKKREKRNEVQVKLPSLQHTHPGKKALLRYRGLPPKTANIEPQG